MALANGIFLGPLDSDTNDFRLSILNPDGGGIPETQ